MDASEMLLLLPRQSYTFAEKGKQTQLISASLPAWDFHSWMILIKICSLSNKDSALLTGYGVNVMPLAQSNENPTPRISRFGHDPAPSKNN